MAHAKHDNMLFMSQAREIDSLEIMRLEWPRSKGNNNKTQTKELFQHFSGNCRSKLCLRKYDTMKKAFAISLLGTQKTSDSSTI